MTRLLVPTILFGYAHLLLIVMLGGAHLGMARAVRDLPNRNPVALRAIVSAGDVLMLPTSVAWWMCRGERFPDSAAGVVETSPLWGIAAACAMQRRKTRDRPSATRNRNLDDAAGNQLSRKTDSS